MTLLDLRHGKPTTRKVTEMTRPIGIVPAAVREGAARAAVADRARHYPGRDIPSLCGGVPA